MRLMGLVLRQRPGVYILATRAPEIAKGEDNAVGGSQPVPEPQPEQMETKAPPTAQEPPPVHMFSPTRAHDRFKRLESVVGVLQVDLAEVRCYQGQRETKKGHALFEDIKARGFIADRRNYCILAHGLTKAGHALEIYKVFYGMKELAPVGYGIKKLQIMMMIMNDLVSVDDLIEEPAPYRGVSQ
ncbi:elongation factor 1-delta 2-like [Dioscorea cayenensis subsp. rotundata]|uniref:Elongation factor 1-delta 2-like n=1 Tax=Dioscorea cayennensis subsp. rotundata TaxID=55577 RepID=A0AB40ATG2_DIOCR|nr:elongation factor 1-delta 2-like [Dioscorea cayenensis subsp. rotundata]